MGFGLLAVPPPRGEKKHLGHICSMMQNFRTVGCTATTISVPGQKKKLQQTSYPEQAILV